MSTQDLTHWRFWAGLFFMFAAISIYVMTDGLAWVPRSQPRHRHQVPSGNLGAP